MFQMVKVLEADRPGRGYIAEIPGRPGHYVRAMELPELRTKLKAAIENPREPSFLLRSAPGSMGFSETALFVRL